MAENQTQAVPKNDKNTFPSGITVTLVKGVETPFALRREDAWLIRSIFEIEEYKLPIKDFQPKLILDCGGNIGCAAVYFANKFPAAQIYSVEPEKNNFKLLTFNTAFYENVHPIKSALWDKETFIRVEDRGHGVAGFMTFETTPDDPAALKTTTVGKLLAESGFDEIDWLKIDIEGAEKEVFSAPDVDKWLPKVKVITIELHDRMKRGCSREFFKAIAKHNYFFHLNGENLIFIREKENDH